MSVRRHSRILVIVAAAGALVASAVPVSAGGAHRPTVIATGLNNPRGLGFAPDGALYVAESGRGGSGPCRDSPEGEVCFGRSGAITRISHGKQRRVLTGLPSLAAPRTGDDAIGPTDVSVDRRGRLYFTVGLGADPAERDDTPQLRGMAKLYRGAGHRSWPVADIGAYEGRVNPDRPSPADTNPYAVLAEKRGQLVADAGGNTLLRVSERGRISTVAVFPERIVPAPPIPDLPPRIPMQSVPTSVVKGPDGAHYVGELTGFPFPAGKARVYRVVPGWAPQVYATGFTNIIDLAFDGRGRLYVLEISHRGLLTGDATGALLRASRRGPHKIIMSAGLTAPGGLAIRGTSAYVSNCGVCAGRGTVLRIALR